MKTSAKKLTLGALFAALALALSYAERWLPLALLVPLPGVKPGLANIVTLFALYCLGEAWAAAIFLTRCLLGAAFAGSVTALLYSLFGGLAALAVMVLLRRSGRFSIYGVSVGGAAAHGCGQIAAAALLLGSYAPLGYLPFLLLLSLVTGSLTALCCASLFRAFRTAHFLEQEDRSHGQKG